MARPCVLFLDEFDAIAKLRDDQHELGELKRVVVSLLQNIDALDSKTVLLAATNHEHLLDSAAWRRFAYKVHIEKPNGVAREQLFAHFLGGFSSILQDKKAVEPEEVLRRIVAIRLTKEANSHTDINARLKAARNLDPKVFTVRRLAGIFQCSTGQVSKLLNASD
jgi:SpoVK/Ycf46/Vps4 family AAA+-type ATPase